MDSRAKYGDRSLNSGGTPAAIDGIGQGVLANSLQGLSARRAESDRGDRSSVSSEALIVALLMVNFTALSIHVIYLTSVNSVLGVSKEVLKIR
jgi:hypothetical protein